MFMVVPVQADRGNWNLLLAINLGGVAQLAVLFHIIFHMKLTR